MVFVLTMFSAGEARGQAEQIRIRVIGGVPCVLVDLDRENISLPSYAVIDIGVRAPALLHTRTAAAMDLQRPGNVSVGFSGQHLQWPSITAVPSEMEPIEQFSAEHAAELDEIPAAIVLGLPSFRGVTTVSLTSGEILHGQEREVLDQATESDEASSLISFEAKSYGYWLTATGPDQRTLRIRLASGERTSRIDVDTAEALRSPDGALAEVRIGGLDLSKYITFEPSDFSEFPDPKPDINLGTDLLEKMDLVIDVTHQVLVLIPRVQPEASELTQAYLSARARGDGDAVEEVLRSGLPEEERASASETLIRMRLDERPLDIDRARRAFALFSETLAENRRAMSLVRVADDAISRDTDTPRAYDAAEAALDLASTWAQDDLDGVAIHHILARQGLIALLRKDYETARRRLIAARFGLPQDPFINLWLGRLYEVTDQPIRAWSRYIQSAMADEPPIGAFRGLKRLDRNPELHERLPADQMRMLLEGQLETLHRRPPSAQKLETDTRPLIELFVDADVLEATPALQGWEALSQMFSQFGLVAHHLQDPMAVSFASERAETLGITRLPALAINGRAVSIPMNVRAETWLDEVMAAVVRSQEDDELRDLAWLDARVQRSSEALDVELDVDALSSPRRGRLRVMVLEQIVFWPDDSSMRFYDWPVRDHTTFAMDLEEKAGDQASDGRRFNWTIPVRTFSEQMSDSQVEENRHHVDPRAAAILVVWEDRDGACLGWKRCMMSELGEIE